MPAAPRSLDRECGAEDDSTDIIIIIITITLHTHTT
jgi:hypothetical protein